MDDTTNDVKNPAGAESALSAGLERTFTLEQMKAAFWETHHECGELWYPYPAMGASKDECESATESGWDEFMDSLMRANVKLTGCANSEGVTKK